MKCNKPTEPCISYFVHEFSLLFFISGILFFGYFWAMSTVSDKKVSTWFLLVPAAWWAAALVCWYMEGYTVYLDGAGIHIHWRNGESLLIPRESLPLCRLHLGTHDREQSTVYVFRKEAAEQCAELLFREAPTEQEYQQYELKLLLQKVRRGKMTREELLRQPVILLVFNENGDNMRKMYQKFRRFWVPEAENEREGT